MKSAYRNAATNPGRFSRWEECARSSIYMPLRKETLCFMIRILSLTPQTVKNQ